MRDFFWTTEGMVAANEIYYTTGCGVIVTDIGVLTPIHGIDGTDDDGAESVYTIDRKKD